jgi:ribonuclease BN (tRNA processing enzyme)
MTTRIFRATMLVSLLADYDRRVDARRTLKLHVVGCSPAWPNPGGAQSGYVLEGSGRLLMDCGPGVLARLRDEEGWPRVDAIAITHFHLDHWGDLVPWVWGSLYGLGHDLPRVELWLSPTGAQQLSEFGERFGWPDMFERVFDLRSYEEGAPFRAAGFDVLPLRLPHYTLETYGFRVTNGDKTLAYSGDSGPSDQLAELAREADLFVCEATLLTGDADGQPRGHLSLEEVQAAFDASGAKRLLITHRPHELPTEDGYEVAYDGLDIEV